MKWHVPVETREQIRLLTEETLRDVVHFKIGKDTTQLVIERMTAHQQDFEHELHQSYPRRVRKSGAHRCNVGP